MQTFLPYASFYQSARVLDRQRLGKQRVECKQILLALQGRSTGWRNHPAVKMWSGYETALVRYAWIVCQEWRDRGYRDTLQTFFETQESILSGAIHSDNLPHWINGRIHETHRSALLAKAPEHYGRFGWREEAKIDYYWPV